MENGKVNVNVNVADVDINVSTRTARFGRYSFRCRYLWIYDMFYAWFQESSDWKLWHDGACLFS